MNMTITNLPVQLLIAVIVLFIVVDHASFVIGRIRQCWRGFWKP